MIVKKLPPKPNNLWIASCQVQINKQFFTKLEIWDYYQKHNQEYLLDLEKKGIKLTPAELSEKLITNELIANILVPQLDGEIIEPDSNKYLEWNYYHFEPVYRSNGKAYRLVFCISDYEPNTLGIMNCYRRKKYDE